MKDNSVKPCPQRPGNKVVEKEVCLACACYGKSTKSGKVENCHGIQLGRCAHA